MERGIRDWKCPGRVGSPSLEVSQEGLEVAPRARGWVTRGISHRLAWMILEVFPNLNDSL